MGILRKLVGGIILVVVIAGIAIGGAYFMGIIEKPSAGLQDYGDWGTVTEQRTEIITYVWVKNPNPVGLKVGNSITISYRINMNDVKMASGKKSGISIQPGNNTVDIHTYIRNEKLDEWWVNFIQNQETIHLRVESSAHIDAGPLSTTIEFPPQTKTVLEDSMPVINSISQAAAAVEGNYTKSISVGKGPIDQTATVGYQVRRGWATWGKVTQETTTVLFHFKIHNPSRAVPVPAVPDGLGVEVEMNNISMFKAQGEAFSPQNVDGDAVIRPQQTQEVVLAVKMNNTKIDDWFRSHVRKGERTQITTRFQLVFTVEGQTFRLPDEGGITYTCQLQTGILVDGQSTQTNCGELSSVNPQGSQSSVSNTGSNTEDRESSIP